MKRLKLEPNECRKCRGLGRFQEMECYSCHGSGEAVIFAGGSLSFQGRSYHTGETIMFKPFHSAEYSVENKKLSIGVIKKFLYKPYGKKNWGSGNLFKSIDLRNPEFKNISVQYLWMEVQTQNGSVQNCSFRKTIEIKKKCFA